MLTTLRTLCVLSLCFSLCMGDTYMHNPRGSNNRLNEKSANRNNANRLFDSQVCNCKCISILCTAATAWARLGLPACTRGLYIYFPCLSLIRITTVEGTTPETLTNKMDSHPKTKSTIWWVEYSYRAATCPRHPAYMNDLSPIRIQL